VATLYSMIQSSLGLVAFYDLGLGNGEDPILVTLGVSCGCTTIELVCSFSLVVSLLQSGSKGSWGEKANDSLKHTQGRSFRHEKTKKKRGSYRGGAIDTGVHSVTFNDSD